MKKATATSTIAFFCGDVAEKKTYTTIASITFFDGFVAKKGDDNYGYLFQWFCYEEDDINNVVAFFYGGRFVKKAMATGCRHLFFFFSFSSYLVLLV